MVASASYLHIVIVESSYRWTVDSLLCHLPVLIPKALDANFRPASGIQGLKLCFCNSSARSSLGPNSLPPEPELHHSNHPTAATPRTSINLKSSFLYIFLQKSMACQVCTLIDFKENSSTKLTLLAATLSPFCSCTSIRASTSLPYLEALSFEV